MGSTPYFKQNKKNYCYCCATMLQLEADTVSQSLRDLASWTEDARNLGADEISNITTTLEDMFFFSFTDLKVGLY